MHIFPQHFCSGFYKLEYGGSELINQLHFYGTMYTVSQIRGKQQLLNQVETIEIALPRMSSPGVNVHEFLEYCTRLKHLKLYEWVPRKNRIRTGIRTINDRLVFEKMNIWLRRHYPTIEHIEIYTKSRFFQLKTFFEQNFSNKRSKFFLHNRNAPL